MSQIPEQLQYTKTHEWVKKDKNLLTVGITDHAQNLLGDLVYVELPEIESTFNIGQECAVIESVKAAADIYCPVACEIVEINQEVINNPQLVNQDPYGRGWLMRVRPLENPISSLLNAEAYTKVVAAETH